MGAYENDVAVEAARGIDNVNRSYRSSMAMSLKRLTDAMCAKPDTSGATAAAEASAKDLAEQKLQTAEMVKQTAELAKLSAEAVKITKALTDRNTLLTAQNVELAKQTAQFTKSATIAEQTALKQGIVIKL